jgi:hypothetical protein
MHMDDDVGFFTLNVPESPNLAWRERGPPACLAHGAP